MTNKLRQYGAIPLLKALTARGRPDTHAQRMGSGYRRIDGSISDPKIEQHLRRDIALSIYPQLGADTHIGVIDLDDHDQSASPELVQNQVVAVLTWLTDRGFRALAFRSGGGRGAHIWIVFRRKQPSSRVREFLRQALATAGLTIGTKGVSANQAEIFPKSDDAGGGYGAAIALPLSRQSVPLGTDGRPLPDSEEWSPPEPEDFLNTDLVGFDPPPGRNRPRKRHAASRRLVQQALARTSADDYGDWINVGLALKSEYGDDGFELWDEWSAKSDKYDGRRDTEKRWETLRPDGRVGIGTIFRMARSAGWEPNDEDGNQAIIDELNSQYGIVTRGNRPYVFEKNPLDRNMLHETLSFETFRARMAAEPPAMVELKGKRDNEPVPMNRGKYWLGHPDASHYRRTVFNPSLSPGENGDVWNLWRGYAVEPTQGDWNLFEAFILDVIASGDPEIAGWILNWMAFVVQNPATPIGTALVLKGEPGTGKTFFADTFGALFGAHYVSITAHAQVSGNFNAHLIGKRFVFIDEGFFSGDRKNLGALKVMLTSSRIMLERKGHDAEPMDNHMVFAMASNERAVAPADIGDRRWMTLRVSSARKEDHEYFRAIDQQMKGGGLSALLFDLQRRDLSKGPNPTKIIRTTELAEDWLTHASPETKFLYQLIDAGGLPEADLQHPNITTIGAMWRALKGSSGSVAYSGQGSLAKLIKEVLPNIRTDQKQHNAATDASESDRSRRYIFPPLAECRKAFERYCGLPMTWTETATDWHHPEDNSTPF